VNEVLFSIDLFHSLWVVTPWKLIGYLSVLIFAARWIVQVVASHRAGRSHLPRLFWYMLLIGSLLLLGYFPFSDKSDSVGLLSNLFPATVAGYNLLLEARCFRREKPGGEGDGLRRIHRHLRL
jgi:lipid-A-disaccharide synthase-like uncharacterized protein